MNSNDFDKLFDGFGEEQERLGYPEITTEQSAILGHFISYLENAGLLMVWNYDMSAAPINQDIRLLIDDGSGGKEDVNGYINKHRTIWRYWYKNEEDYGSSTTQNAIAWMLLPKGD